MKNVIYLQKISKLILEKQKNRSRTRAISPMRIINYLSESKYRKAFLSKHARRRAYTQVLIGATLSLSGCMGVYEGGFECPPGKGVGCKSISDVNKMVNHGELPPKSLSDFPHEHCERCEVNQDGQVEAEHSGKLEELQIWFSPWALEEA